MRQGLTILILVATFFCCTRVCGQSPAESSLQAIYDVYDSNNLKLNKKEVRGREGFYKKIISRQISASCEYQKTCSHFMREATSAFGLFGGLLLGIDRLSRCGASQNTYSFLPSLIDQENYLLIEQMKHYE
ncbi:MAG: membrane protein insertion efficiency factor YidD [Bacteroidota bacterium]|jgi:putative component of membrane protein insertase Oxa1/YidC/SpoIIIJ protein YidD